MRITVFHSSYGCETGCCGHVIEVDDTDDGFEFEHPDTKESARQWAEDWVTRKFGAEHVADLDWDNCAIVSSKEC